jgi:hypothetical protein
MSPFLQSGPGSNPAFRPVVIGVLTCGALMMSAGAAQADHRMADGTLCPHAAGTLAPGELPAAPTIERAASSAPIGAASSTRSAPAAKPAAKPATKPPVQRPAVQAQAQRPAASHAQAQRPAAASQPAVSNARVATPVRSAASAERQAPVARPSGVQQPKAAAGTHRTVKQPVAQPVVEPAVIPDVTIDQRGVERPTASAAAARPADSGGAISSAALAGLLGLFGIAVAGMVAVRRRVVRVRVAASTPSLETSRDAAIEAELQEIIAEARVRALRAPAVDDDAAREFSETH